MPKVKAETMEKIIQEAPKDTAVDKMPLTSYDEYKAYNLAARKENKRLKLCRYPCKPCPIPLHPSQRVIFNRTDQPLNALPVHLSNHLIHFEETLYPGKTYDLPCVVINYLADKGVPHWEWFTNPDGSSETRLDRKEPRFSLRTVYAE